ncbi:MAG: cytochrome c biogenesis protein CcsA [Gemmatimonadota bacterium]
MSELARLDPDAFKSVRRWAAALTVIGGASVIGALWMVFFYVPTEATMGVMQRIYYIHIPTAWLGEFAFFLVALCSAGYLLLHDDRLDSIALSAAEVGFIFLTGTLVAGPLWARLAWGAWWVWDARLAFSLLLWLIWIAYFILRQAMDDPETGKRMAAILAIIGALDLPLIHMSVYWFDTVHPEPVMMNPEGPTADFEIGITIGASVTAFTIFFFGILLYRYGLERLQRQVEFLRVAQLRRST